MAPRKKPDQATAVVINETGLPMKQIEQALTSQLPEVAALARWHGNVRGGGLFERDRYVTPHKLFDQFKVALDAVESDDICSGVLETTESLAFNRISIECDDEDEEDIWSQILDDMDILIRVREMWRELFTVSQFYCAILWGRKTYKVRGVTEGGNKKKKEYKNLQVPIGISILDPLKVLPVGNFLFRQELLAYVATPKESDDFDNVLAGNNTTDLIVSQLINGKYDLSFEEKRSIRDVTGGEINDLYLMNPKTVFRHTATRPDYQKFANVRMKSVFELLDIKHQLRQMDRTHLLATTNFIVLVKKGSDTMPAQPSELVNLTNQVRAAARVPIIVGDHRLSVEIITPATDQTLVPERYNTLDARITARLFQMFQTGNYAAGAKGDDSIKLARLVARGMETRRAMMAHSLMKNIFVPAFERNPQLTAQPNLVFHPKRIALDFDPNVLTFLADSRDRGDLSRDTLLGEMDIDQKDEARKRRREQVLDDLFEPPALKFQPDPVAPGGGGGASNPKPTANKTPSPNQKNAGRKGGAKGGTNRDSFTSNPGRGPSKSDQE